MLILQKKDEFEQMLNDLLDENKITPPPSEDASDEENIDYITDNISVFREWARKRWDELIRGRKQ